MIKALGDGNPHWQPQAAAFSVAPTCPAAWRTPSPPWRGWGPAAPGQASE